MFKRAKTINNWSKLKGIEINKSEKAKEEKKIPDEPAEKENNWTTI